MQENPLFQVKKYIEQLDLSMIVKKLIGLGWKAGEAELAMQQYKKLLYLWKKYENEGPLPPSEDIDEVWHTHILDTEKYHRDCQEIFGRYLHHYPYFGIDNKTDQNDLEKAFEKTKSLYHKEFGEELTCARVNITLALKSLFQFIFKNKSRRNDTDPMQKAVQK